MRTFIPIFLFLCLFAGHYQLEAQSKMWVFFQDKGPEVEQQLLHPVRFLSETALERRKERQIAFTISDLPVYEGYLSRLETMGLKPLMRSRWLNAVVVDLPSSRVDEVAALPCVSHIQRVQTLVRTRSEQSGQPIATAVSGRQLPAGKLDYGQASLQNEMINIPALHEKGFTGRGVRIALFDAGFRDAHRMQAFDSLRKDGRLLAFYDFVANSDSSLFHADDHGTEVMSTILANLPGQMIGTAPHASVVLCRTEDASSETRQEEYNWVRALEWVDSIGVDIIHTSLGYHDFDRPEEDYAYSDLDGNTAVISRAADMAAAKGILVTTSAGNEGVSRWRHITAPCDADSVLCIGSVNKSGKYSSFSSIGPTADNRIKPDVVAMGSRTTVFTSGDRLTQSDGTSFSAPIVAGMVACLKQAHPDRSHLDIIQAVRLSADQYLFPDEKYGYGIPDAAKADSLLSHVQDLSTVQIVMAEKPRRGKPRVKPQQIEVAFTNNPRTKVDIQPHRLLVQTEGSAVIEEVYLQYGKQKLTFDPTDIQISASKAAFNTDYLLRGKTPYYLYIKTDQYEERIPLSL